MKGKRQGEEQATMKGKGQWTRMKDNDKGEGKGKDEEQGTTGKMKDKAEE